MEFHHAFGGLDQPSDEADERALAAARRAEQRDDVVLRHLEIDFLEDGCRGARFFAGYSSQTPSSEISGSMSSSSKSAISVSHALHALPESPVDQNHGQRHHHNAASQHIKVPRVRRLADQLAQAKAV